MSTNCVSGRDYDDGGISGLAIGEQLHPNVFPWLADTGTSSYDCLDVSVASG